MTRFDEEHTAKLIAAVRQRFPKSQTACAYWEKLLLEYARCSSAPPHLLTEIATGDEHKFWTNVWEAMLYRHLCQQGFAVGGFATKAGQRGPDFRILHESRTIWIEAVTPEPKGLPEEWLAPLEDRGCVARRMPHEAMLLRWTSVLKDKRAKLEKDARAGIIGNDDCTIIAVNCCSLYDHATNDLGISQLPFAVEAAFPIGPLAIRVTLDGEIDGEPEHSSRLKIRKPTGVDVPTSCFLDPRYANVSAIISAYQNIAINDRLALTAVHNPLAKTRLPTGLLGVQTEYVAEPTEDGYILSRLPGNR